MRVKLHKEEQISVFSNEQQVSKETPPTWLTHTGEVKIVPVENSIRFCQALINKKSPQKCIYTRGNHGFVLNQPLEEWMQPLFRWMQLNRWVQ